MIKTSPKDVTDSLLRLPQYTLDERQQALEDKYRRIVLLLNKAGFSAQYNKFWTWETGVQPGYITLEEETDA